MDIRELVLQMRRSPSDRAVAERAKMHRQTVKRYRAWAKVQGLLSDEPLPSLGELEKLVQATLPEKPPPQNLSSVEPFRETVKELRRTKTEMTAIHERLLERGFTGSYSAVRRFVHTLEPNKPKEVFVRVETGPGQQVQVDFGYAGKMLDPASGKLRKTWAFVMTLSYSRHQYVEFVFDQTVATWLLCHRHAFEFFGGSAGRSGTGQPQGSHCPGLLRRPAGPAVLPGVRRALRLSDLALPPGHAAAQGQSRVRRALREA